MILFKYDATQRKLWIIQQRIHHGPVGLIAAWLLRKHARLALLSACWGMTDIRDLNDWFRLGTQIMVSQENMLSLLPSASRQRFYKRKLKSPVLKPNVNNE